MTANHLCSQKSFTKQHDGSLFATVKIVHQTMTISKLSVSMSQSKILERYAELTRTLPSSTLTVSLSDALWKPDKAGEVSSPCKT